MGLSLMKVTRSAQNLLAAQFTYNGQVSASAVHTCEGTLPLWGQLVLAGLVEPYDESPLGHPFSYRLTDAGRAYLGEIYSPYDFPYFCRVCRNTFSRFENLRDHHARKHSHTGIPAPKQGSL
jgi:hypothetical protein